MSQPLMREREIRTTPDPAPQVDAASSSLKGVALLVASTMFFAAGDVLTKLLTATVPAAQVAWMRYTTFAILVVPFMLRNGGAAVLRSRHYGLQFLRALGVAGSTIMFTNALRFLPVADGTAIFFISPILIMALSVVFLGETVGWRRWIAAAAGLAGVLIIVRPGTGAFQPAAILALLGATSWAAAGIVTRKMSGNESALTTLTYSSVVGCLVLSLGLVMTWKTPNAHELLLGLSMGTLSTIGQWCIVLAYKHSNASILAPFSYIQLILAGVLGYLVFGSIPDHWTVTGAGIIALSGLYMVYRERVRARRS